MNEALTVLHEKTTTLLFTIWGTTDPERLREIGADRTSIEAAQALSMAAAELYPPKVAPWEVDPRD